MAPATSPRRLRWADGLLRRLATGRTSVEPEAAALSPFLPAGGVCCDIGAEYGLYTLTFAHRVGPHGRVLSFEPLPGPHAMLSRVVRWLGAPHVTVQRQALGDTAGRGTLSLPRRRGLPVHGRAFLADDADGLGPNTEFAGEQRLSVDVSTLDAVVAARHLDRLDLVKVDVEGAEPAVLRGAAETIRRFRPVWLIEIEDRHLGKFGADSTTVMELLTEHGYAMSTLCNGRWEATDVVTGDTRNYLFTPGSPPTNEDSD